MDSRKIAVSGGFCVISALLLLLVPLPWLFAGALAALWHELCHYLAIKLICHEGAEVKLYSFATCLSLPQMTQGRELCVALSGPIGGLLLLPFAQWIPRIALCAAMQSLYNLIPVYPLDGGRALKSCLLLLIPPPVVMGICRVMAWISKLFIVVFALYCCFWLRMGLFPLLLALLWLIRIK